MNESLEDEQRKKLAPDSLLAPGEEKTMLGMQALPDENGKTADYRQDLELTKTAQVSQTVQVNQNIQVSSQMPQRLRKLRKTHEGILFAPKQANAAKNHIGLIDGAIIGGAYRIKKQIGRGGMGEVYLAEHTALDKLCALKVIPPEQVTEVGWERFKTEAKTIARLEHINLLKVSDLGIHEGCLPFYAMEYVEGETLAEIIEREKTIALAEVLEIFNQLCDGLDYAHRNSIVHRDLKPANIMICRHSGGAQHNHPTVKILDFGLAKLTQQDKNRQSLTAVGEVFGSPSYMSPEQCNGERIDNRSDIYSLGCTLFECLTGRPPFVGRLAAAVVFNHQETPPPTLASIVGAGKFSEDLEVLLAKTLRKNPVERYQTMLELKGDLALVAHGQHVLPVYMPRTRDAAASLSGSLHRVERSQYRGGIGPDGAADLNQEDDEEEQDYDASSGASRRFAPPLMVSVLCLVLILGLTGAYYYYTQHKELKAAAVPILTEPTAADTVVDKQTAPAANVFDAMNDATVFPTSGADGAAPASATDSEAYANVISAGGVEARRFNFPIDVTLGNIHSKGNLFAFAARGKIEYAMSERIFFEPDQILAKYQNYVKRFRDGDIYSITIPSFDNSDALLKVCSTIPGVKQLCLDHCSTITAKGIDDIALYKDLDSLRCNYTQARMATLADLPRLSQLTALSLAGQKGVTPILAKLKGNENMEEIVLNDCKLTPADFAAIAQVPNLKVLSLNYDALSDQDLSQLTALKHLQQLSILDMKISGETAKILSEFAGLKKLYIISAPNEHAVAGPLLTRVRNQLPTVNVY